MSDAAQARVLVPYLTEMFRFQAWMAMGKVASPLSGKVERDLSVAKQMIDLLGELEVRTEGNRSDEETKMLQGVLTELRMNYMEEVNKPDPEPAAEEGSAEASESAEAGGEPAEASETPAEEETKH